MFLLVWHKEPSVVDAASLVGLWMFECDCLTFFFFVHANSYYHRLILVNPGPLEWYEYASRCLDYQKLHLTCCALNRRVEWWSPGRDVKHNARQTRFQLVAAKHVAKGKTAPHDSLPLPPPLSPLGRQILWIYKWLCSGAKVIYWVWVAVLFTGSECKHLSYKYHEPWKWHAGRERRGRCGDGQAERWGKKNTILQIK